VIVAQISDTHVKPEGRLAYRRVDTAPYLARAVRHLLDMTPPPDVVLATGDLVDGGLREEYRRLRALLAPLTMPVYLIPGNHDDRDALRAEFPDHAYLPRDGFLQYVVEGYPLRLIGLDTLVPGKGSGLLCAERLSWLDARLREARDRPTLVFMHHPPFRTGIWHMDALGLDNAEGMAAVIRHYPQIAAIVCGHLHRPIQVRWHGTIALTSPSTAHQVALDLRPDGPSAFMMEPPACLLHVWRPDTGLLSHTSYVGDFDGPYPFFENGRLIE
jgi:3',5'-cyclic AMP phosphodiesterase CpdA